MSLEEYREVVRVSLPGYWRSTLDLYNLTDTAIDKIAKYLYGKNIPKEDITNYIKNHQIIQIMNYDDTENRKWYNINRQIYEFKIL